MLLERHPLDRPGPKILLIEPDPALLELLQFVFEAEGYTVATSGRIWEALERVNATGPDLVILEPWQGPASHWGVLAQLAADPLAGDLPCIVCSVDHRGLKEHESELSTRGWIALPKPFDLDALVETVERLSGAGRPLQSAEPLPARSDRVSQMPG